MLYLIPSVVLVNCDIGILTPWQTRSIGGVVFQGHASIKVSRYLHMY